MARLGQLTSAQVTTASGTTSQHFETQPVGHCPQPPASATTPKDVACGSAGFGGEGKGQAAGSMSMINTAGGGQPPAGGGTVTSIHGSNQAQRSGTVTSTNGG